MSSFDWRAAERQLNSVAQFTADIDGRRVHFVHERGAGRDAFPLVLTRGWPSSFAGLLKLAPLLTDPAAHGGDERDSFPSLPGFAFSAPPGEVRAWLVEAPREATPDLAAGMGHATGGVTGLTAGAGYLGIGADAFPSGLSGRAARRASSGWAIGPHGSPLISNAGRSPGRAGRAMISMQAWGQTAEAPAARPGNRSEPTGRDPQ